MIACITPGYRVCIRRREINLHITVNSLGIPHEMRHSQGDDADLIQAVDQGFLDEVGVKLAKGGHLHLLYELISKAWHSLLQGSCSAWLQFSLRCHTGSRLTRKQLLWTASHIWSRKSHRNKAARCGPGWKLPGSGRVALCTDLSV